MDLTNFYIFLMIEDLFFCYNTNRNYHEPSYDSIVNNWSLIFTPTKKDQSL